jgi:hypothetical protein
MYDPPLKHFLHLKMQVMEIVIFNKVYFKIWVRIFTLELFLGM